MLIAVSLLALPLAASAQEFVAPSVPRPTPAPAVEPAPAVGGIVGAALRTSQPWQLINPFARRGYGTGEGMVSHDPNQPGKPKGFIVFAIEW